MPPELAQNFPVAKANDAQDEKDIASMSEEELDELNDFIDDDGTSDGSNACEDNSVPQADGPNFSVNNLDMSMFDGLGNAPFYTIDNEGKKLPVPNPIHYRHRGQDLKVLNRHEYYSLVKIQKGSTGNNKRGRKPSKRFSFSIHHPLSSTHSQHLMSKHPVLVCSGRPPKHPGMPPREDKGGQIDEWEKNASVFARYYLCMFRPEDEGKVHDYSWDAFVDFVEDLQASNAALCRFRLRAMQKHIQTNSSTYRFKRCLQLYRAKSRTVWDKSKQAKLIDACLFLSTAEIQEDQEDLDEEEYELKHKEIPRHHSQAMEKSIEYSDTLLKRVESELHAGWKKNKTAPVDIDVSLYLDQERQDYTQHQYKIGDCGDSSSADDNSPMFFNREKGKKTKHLKEGQVRALTMAKEMLLATTEKNGHPKMPTSSSSSLPVRLMLLTGAAGTEKSHVITEIQKCASQIDRPQLSMANNALNAVHINGSTIDSLFHVPKVKKNENFDDMYSIEPLTDEHKIKRLRTSLGVDDNPVVFIDEVSNVCPYKIALIDSRLRQVCEQSDEPFGGLMVVFVGDFRQIGPVGAHGITRAAMNLAIHDEEQEKEEQMLNELTQCTGPDCSQKRHRSRKAKNDSLGSHNSKSRGSKSKILLDGHRKNKYTEGSAYRLGVELLTKAKWCQLTEQVRNMCSCHQQLLDKFEEGKSIAMSDLSCNYKMLTGKDLCGSKSSWHKAPVIVTTHRERNTLTTPLATNFAQKEGKVVYQWQTQRSKWQGSPPAVFKEECINDDGAFWETFVQGAAAYITDNMDKKLGIVNGTKVTFHSLTPRDLQQKEEMTCLSLCLRNKPLIRLSQPPLSVNVELVSPHAGKDADSKRKHKLWLEKFSNITLVEGKVVIALYDKRPRGEWKSTTIKGNGHLFPPSKVCLKSRFPLIPGFAVTVHKAQGMTLDNVILSLGMRPEKQMNLDYESLYVAFSRVKHKQDIRVLLPQKNDWISTTYIMSLEPDRHTRSFFAGFNKKGAWDKLKALKFHRKNYPT